MLNKDINSRFEDWLLNPIEGLDFEVKQWLDMTDPEAQGLVAKALIALENHGGGFLLFGYMEDAQKKLIPDPNRPTSLEPYLGDALNAIVKRRAEPSFHVEVTLQKHPATGDEYPLVRVRGTSRVPVRSDSATSGGTLKQHVYYVRAPGPESRGPLDASEWDALLRRAVLNQREEIVRVLRSILPSAGGVALLAASSVDDELNKFADTARIRWKSLNVSLPEDHPARIKLGHFDFAAHIIGTSKGTNAAEIRAANEQARKYTGWPAFVTMYDADTKPKMVDDCIEAWVANVRFPDVGHADFWRIRPDGYFFQLRGYQEDSTDRQRGFTSPGKSFEATLPIWRLGEFLLRVSELGAVMYEEGFEVLVKCEWTGLTGRQLFVHNHRRWVGSGKSEQDVARTSGRFPGAVRDVLPEIVKALTMPLYEKFDFTQIDDSVYSEELAEMSKNKF